MVQDQLDSTMPSAALHAVQDSCCWAWPLSPLLFYALAPILGNDLLSNHQRGEPPDHAMMLARVALHAIWKRCCIDSLHKTGYSGETTLVLHVPSSS